LRQIVVVPPPPPPPPTTVYIFEEITARVEIRVKGKFLKSESTFNDFYGVETCIEMAIDEAEKYVERNGIGPRSDIEVVVVKSVRRSPRIVDALDKENFYDKTFIGFRRQETEKYRDPTPGTSEDVWSSKSKKRAKAKV